MINNSKSPEHEGLCFFGKINASISHELRNALAVINENAGLIKDLLLMTEKGHPLDTGRVNGRVEKVLEQVRRTDTIVDNLNRFAHSIDNDFSKVDVFEYMEFIIRLSKRFADMKKVKLELKPLGQRVEITTFPFLFENLLFICIDYAMKSTGEDRIISMLIEKLEESVHIRFTGLNKEDETKNPIFQDSKEIFKKLNARIIVGDISGSFILDMPENLKV